MKFGPTLLCRLTNIRGCVLAFLLTVLGRWCNLVPLWQLHNTLQEWNPKLQFNQHDDGAWRSTVCHTDVTTPDAGANLNISKTLHCDDAWRYTERCTVDITPDTSAKLPEQNESAPDESTRVQRNTKTEIPPYWWKYNPAWFSRLHRGQIWDQLNAWIPLHLILAMHRATSCKSWWQNLDGSSRFTDVKDGMPKCV